MDTVVESHPSAVYFAPNGLGRHRQLTDAVAVLVPTLHATVCGHNSGEKLQSGTSPSPLLPGTVAGPVSEVLWITLIINSSMSPFEEIDREEYFF